MDKKICWNFKKSETQPSRMGAAFFRCSKHDELRKFYFLSLKLFKKCIKTDVKSSPLLVFTTEVKTFFNTKFNIFEISPLEIDNSKRCIMKKRRWRKTQKLKWARCRHPPASPFTTGVSGRAAPAARVAALARSTRARARARARAKKKKKKKKF